MIRTRFVADDGATTSVVMATLNIGRLPEDVHAKLRVRAVKAGRSTETEARRMVHFVLRELLAQAEPAGGAD